MKLKVLVRKVHYWCSIVAALPMGIIVASGLLLQSKKWVAWIQPAEQAAAPAAPAVSLPDLLTIVRTVPQAEIDDWNDISRIDVRPSRGLLKVTSHNRWEIQIDAGNGDVLQVAYRRSDLIEAIHDGSWFGTPVRLAVFIPAGALLIVIWATGLYLFFLPWFSRRQVWGRSALRSPPPT